MTAHHTRNGGAEVGKLVIRPKKEWETAPDGRKVAAVASIKVNPPYQRRGIGSALYKRGAQILAKDGAVLGSDSTQQMSSDALGFWNKQVAKGRAKKITLPMYWPPSTNVERYVANGPNSLDQIDEALSTLWALLEAEGGRGDAERRGLMRSAAAEPGDTTAAEKALRQLFRDNSGPDSKEAQEILGPFEKQMIAAFKAMKQFHTSSAEETSLVQFIRAWHFKLQNVHQQAEHNPRPVGVVATEMRADEKGWRKLAMQTFRIAHGQDLRSVVYPVRLFRTPAGYAISYMAVYPGRAGAPATCFSASHFFRQGFSITQDPSGAPPMWHRTAVT